ncbi:MAG: phosphoglycolate phosphatase [Burkholderiales bacterium]|nr:phosphoglycolate phosphatase [Burkholderiales bacterium]
MRAVLCDLDGTLLDTAPDLALAANRVLRELGLPALAQDEVSRYIGQGSRLLLERCLRSAGAAAGVPTGEAMRDRALALYFGYYAEETGRTRVYPGVREGLDALCARGLALACVTNKPRRFAAPLLERHGLAARFQSLVAGDDVERIKPDPQPYRRACELLASPPAEAVVIGDSANDVESGRAAGCRVLCVPYGYREGAGVEELGADAVVADLLAAAHWIRAVNARSRSGGQGGSGPAQR